jgi:hypothetical protein
MASKRSSIVQCPRPGAAESAHKFGRARRDVDCVTQLLNAFPKLRNRPVLP